MQPSRLLAASVAAASFAPCARAQLDVVWDRALTARNTVDVVLGADHRVYHLGWWHGPSATHDGVVTQLRPDGTTVWERWFHHADADSLRAIAPLPGGGVVACGWSDADPSGAEQLAMCAVRYDSDGNELWRRYVDLAPIGDEMAVEARATAAGEILLAGTGSPTLDGEDLALWKYAADGTLLWSRYVDHAAGSRDKGQAFDVDAAGNAVVFGDSLGRRMILAKVDAGGTLLWQQSFLEANNGYSIAVDVALDAAGSAYCLGVTEVAGGSRIVVLKFDATGAFEWHREVVGPLSQDDSPREIRVDVRGDVLVCGYLRGSGGNVDGFVAKLSPQGDTRWVRTVDGPSHGADAIGALLLAADGDVYACGNLAGTTAAGPSQALVVRYDADGVEKWRHAYDTPHVTPSSDGWSDILADSDGAILTAGTTRSLTPGDAPIPALARFERTTTSFCFGDGAPLSCPCANESVVGLGSGCRNSLGVGARLTDSGVASISGDSFRLAASGMPNSSVVFYQGDNASTATFGDGLRCASGAIRRLRTRAIVGGSASYPLAGEPPISVVGQVTTAFGLRTYQAIYRNPAAFCTADTFNSTNALSVVWAP